MASRTLDPRALVKMTVAFKAVVNATDFLSEGLDLRKVCVSVEAYSTYTGRLGRLS